jgi:hypothetical protein
MAASFISGISPFSGVAAALTFVLESLFFFWKHHSISGDEAVGADEPNEAAEGEEDKEVDAVVREVGLTTTTMSAAR